jgi:YesN/AraC family two-component response regulator
MIVQGITPYSCYLLVFDMFYNQNRINLYTDLSFFNSSETGNTDCSTYPAINKIEYELPHVMNVQQFSKFEMLFHSMYNEYIKSNLSNQFYLKTYLMQILMLAHSEWLTVKVLQNSKRSILANYPKVMEVKRYIENNVSSRLEIQKLADHAGLSPNFLCSVFKKILGYNIVEYINICKINMAKKALLDTNKAVKEISIDCGFDNEAYFYTLFKKLEGLRPTEYREKNRLMFRGDT